MILLLIYIALLWTLHRGSKIIFAHVCAHYITSNDSIYSWCWIILPNWRYYIRLAYKDNHSKYGRYSDHYWLPNRNKLWKISGYDYKVAELIKKHMFTLHLEHKI